MSESFIAAKASGDIISIRRFEREAIALAGSKASAQTKLRARVLRDEMRTWIKARESEEALESMRTVFETLPSPAIPEKRSGSGAPRSMSTPFAGCLPKR
ncbi:hypothetical protein NQP46_05080 [Streptomyces albus]|nr:hypothetical protein NQP46_05080 [Streptomyces albus]